VQPNASTDSSEEERAFLQERLTLFSKTLLVLYAAALAIAWVVLVLVPTAAPPRVARAHELAAVGVAALGVVLLVARKKRQSLGLLRLLDTTIMTSVGAVIGAGAFDAGQTATHGTVPFAFAGLTVFARVFLVPGSARRTAWLASLCIGPPAAAAVAVAARAPEALGMPLVVYGTGAAGLAVGTTVLATIGTSVIFGLRREVRAARRYGQYTLERKLGEGGMGVVFKARHALLRRPTAIKLLPPHKASPEDVARFEREVQLTSELTHPNTIAIFDYGRSADGVFYYVMEYLDGIDLETLVERDGALPAARVVPILVQICDALDEAHARGVVHRDIKPANVLLCRRGQMPDFVKVVDFGLVKELSTEANVTAPGTITGTPAYLAPEALTDPEGVGPPSDLYAVGAVAYFLLTGKMVFEGKTILAIVNDHLHTTPVPPSERASGIPRELEALVLACLAKKPAERPASARALADALSTLGLTTKDWSKSDAEAWWTRFESQRTTATPSPADRGADTQIADTIAILPRPS
jgi:serine/threonine-protein kinase